MEALLAAFAAALAPQVLLVVVAASVYGLFIGAVPGLTATMGTALLVPLTFFLEPLAAIGAIVAASTMAIFAGDIPGALLRIPGTPASAAYTDDAYRLTQKGQAGLALGTNLVCSVLGGLIGVAILVLAAPRIARFSLGFSSYEYFWLALLGLSCATAVSRGSAVKGGLSICAGLLISMIGIDIVTGTPRFTFGDTPLIAGVSIIPVLIGMFAITEILRKCATPAPASRPEALRLGALFAGVGGTVWRYKGGVARSSVLGAFIGALPGAGADIAAWISYAVAKRFSREPEKFGTGHAEGIVSASSSNNAALSGAYVPALVFGIPGDTITAILIGVLMMKGVTPGPMVFVMDQGLVGAIFAIFVVANLLLLPLGTVAILLSQRLLAVPANVLFPIILLFCAIGAFATNNAYFDIWIMLAVGLLAFALEENGYPLAPMILALILGPQIEESFMQSIIKADGHLLAFFSRPIAGTLGVLTLAIWLAVALLALRSGRRAAGAARRAG
ncbi:MAG TPA: tripartite tricarboxylate transporter permease [Geminicoccaceae bacterium]|nr:tripartite tricarboxylate transporter permease [Geminicoccaceae bacterium]